MASRMTMKERSSLVCTVMGEARVKARERMRRDVGMDCCSDKSSHSLQ